MEDDRVPAFEDADPALTLQEFLTCGDPIGEVCWAAEGFRWVVFSVLSVIADTGADIMRERTSAREEVAGTDIELRPKELGPVCLSWD